MAKAELVHTGHTVAEGAGEGNTLLLDTAVRTDRQTKVSLLPLAQSGDSSHHRPEEDSLFLTVVGHTLSYSPSARPQLCELNDPSGSSSSLGSWGTQRPEYICRLLSTRCHQSSADLTSHREALFLFL